MTTRIRPSSVNNSLTYTLGGLIVGNSTVTTLSANSTTVVVNTGFYANGSLGSAGQVLASNGTGLYWATGGNGYTGSQGPAGFAGSIGTTGFTGSIGGTGYTGSIGPNAGIENQILYKDSSNTLVGSSNLTFNGSTFSVNGFIESTYAAGDEGGEIHLAKPLTNSTISGSVNIDIYQNKLRIFESSGTNRGAYIDLTAATAGVGSNLLAGGGGGTGYDGSVGFTGSQGTIGYTGSVGTTGYTGSQGVGYVGSQGANSLYTTSNTAPLSPTAGDRWFHTDYGIELVYTNDGDSSQWVEIAASGFMGQIGPIGYTGSQPASMVMSSQPSTYTLQATDDTKLISTSANVTVSSGVFSNGQTVSIYNANTTTNLTIIQGGSVTLYLSGTTSTGNRTLGTQGLATIICVNSVYNNFIITGSGLS